MGINIKELTDSRDTVNKCMERFGVRFGVYKKGVFNEQLFPFDSVPRIIPKKDWDYLERGLEQRVRALNMFLWDIYHEKKIIKDGVVPEEFVYSSKGYMPQCEGISPTGKVYVCGGFHQRTDHRLHTAFPQKDTFTRREGAECRIRVNCIGRG